MKASHKVSGCHKNALNEEEIIVLHFLIFLPFLYVSKRVFPLIHPDRKQPWINMALPVSGFAQRLLVLILMRSPWLESQLTEWPCLTGKREKENKENERKNVLTNHIKGWLALRPIRNYQFMVKDVKMSATVVPQCKKRIFYSVFFVLFSITDL